MLLIVCEFFLFFFYCNTIRYLQPHYRLSTDSLQPTTDSLQTLYSLLWTLYRLSTAYYGLSTDSLHSTMALYSLSTDSLQPHCSSAVQNIEVTTGTTALQHFAALCSKPEFADVG